MPTLTVINGNDTGAGSLRAQIAAAVTGDTIVFDASVTAVILTSDELELVAKALTITGPGSSLLTIQRSQAIGTPDFRILRIRPGNPTITGPVTISGMTLNNGSVSAMDIDVADGGGGILIGGTPQGGSSGATDLITLDDVKITGCASPSKGGGLSNSGTVVMTDCEFSGNSVVSAADGYGGGVFNQGTINSATDVLIHTNSIDAADDGFGGGWSDDGGTVTLATGWIVRDNMVTAVAEASGGGLWNAGTGTYVECTFKSNSIDGATKKGAGVTNTSDITLTRSTISANTGATNGGGLFIDGGTSTIENSTISGNTATNGAGIYANAATVNISNSTITANTATAGGGLFNIDGTVFFFDTIISANTGDFDIWSETCSTVSQGHNLIGTHGEDDPGSYTAGAGDITSSLPMLGTLSDNGGPTFTHALLTGSPAINTGDNTGAPANDQRGTGFTRIITTTIDIGSYEYNPDDPPTPVEGCANCVGVDRLARTNGRC